MSALETSKAPDPLTKKDLEQQTEEVVTRVEENALGHAANAESITRLQAIVSEMAVEEAASRIAIDKQFNRYALIIIVAFVFMTVIGGVNFFRSLNPMPGQALFEIGIPVISGASELCPGETLDFIFEVSVEEAGVLVLDMSTWKVDPPPATIIFSERDVMVISEARTFTITRQWQIPDRYPDPATNELVEWVPGAYTRDIAVSAQGLNTDPSTQAVPFMIKEDCS